MTAILNGEREVQVGDKICRFVEAGMIMYDANEKVLFNPNFGGTEISRRVNASWAIC